MSLLSQLFAPRRPRLDSLYFDTLGWPLRDQERHHRAWQHPSLPALLSVDFFPIPPDLPQGLYLSPLRQYFRRRLLAQHGGLLEVDRAQLAETPLVRTLFKFPQEPDGIGYIGALTLPFRDCSFVVKLQAYEHGFTGSREAVVAEKLLRTGQLHITDEGYRDWFADPYDPYYTAGTPMNRAEHPEYDHLFPDHPLSLVRQHLPIVQRSLRLQPELERAAPFA